MSDRQPTPHSGDSAASDADMSGSDEPGQSPNTEASKGFFNRLFDVLSPAETVDAQAALEPQKQPETLPIPGMANLRRLRVDDVLVPKAEIMAIERNTSQEDLLAIFRSSGFSRIPVYDETLDKPMGLLLLKDIVLKIGFDLSAASIDIAKLLRPILFVPSSMSLMVLLQKMQAERTHMALVIDEYGGVEGLVTIEDLLEQVVGQIEDEHDTDDENLWHLQEPGIWLVQARAQLDDLSAALGTDLQAGMEDDDIDTLGGLVFVLLGRVPARGEVFSHPAGHEIEVLEADPRRVKRLRVRLSSDVETANATAK